MQSGRQERVTLGQSLPHCDPYGKSGNLLRRLGVDSGSELVPKRDWRRRAAEIERSRLVIHLNLVEGRIGGKWRGCPRGGEDSRSRPGRAERVEPGNRDLEAAEHRQRERRRPESKAR
jgi:hypothetical protein